MYVPGQSVRGFAYPGNPTPPYEQGDHGDASLVCLSPSGDPEWGISFGGSDDEWADSVVVTPNGRIYVAGISWSQDFPAGSEAPYGAATYVAEVSPQGLLWAFGLDYYATGAPTLVAGANGDLWLVCFTGGYGADIYIARIHGGAVDWASYCGTPLTERFNGAATDADGNLILAVESYDSYTGTQFSDYVMKITAAGEVAWLVRAPEVIWPKAVAVDARGDIWLAGTVGTSREGVTDLGGTDGSTDAMLARMSPDGRFLWAGCFGGSGMDRPYDLATTATGDVYVVGTTRSADMPSDGGFDHSLWNGVDTFVARLSMLAIPDEPLPAARVGQAYTASVGRTGGERAVAPGPSAAPQSSADRRTEPLRGIPSSSGTAARIHTSHISHSQW